MEASWKDVWIILVAATGVDVEGMVSRSGGSGARLDIKSWVGESVFEIHHF